MFLPPPGAVSNLNRPLDIDFPSDLPVSARREEIMSAIRAHPVVIVCGETGSGKTTQLPKMALALGRGLQDVQGSSQPKRRPIIGHTQPRRIAATSVAKRIADELKTPLGDVVGYKVRFQDKLSPQTCVKLMTDGILLAEIPSDPLLLAYDTLIIDEAHERSLNIDFLLGYLKQILPRRPDLKIIITSATIDADRFASHFASEKGPAPVVMVSGRTYPVTLLYQPWEESKDFDLNDAIAQAVDALWGSRAKGDILVFLPGEREIRDAAEHLRGHFAQHPVLRQTEILPLFGRLSQEEQERVFQSSAAPRVVLATNVAETSLTVPGIRYVIDTGLARVKRYSYRNKVEQLGVEPISQAAANQRAGRCGRVADGVCIRLYDEKDFLGRPRFTEPEILRSSLAGVILQMMALRLGEVSAFPFLEAPKPKAVADGFQLLHELGAVDEQHRLTSIGKTLARLPLDPRVGRMILAARERHALREVLIIASALSVQDVRERPLQAQTQADQAHARFKDEKSEFSSYLRLWEWLSSSRGGQGGQPRLSNRQYEQLLRQSFINVRRYREWRDVHAQLLTVVHDQRWLTQEKPAGYEALHLALLTGLLGNIGCQSEDTEVYLGARGIRFYRHPSVKLSKKLGRWVVCAELVETTRLFGRGMAQMDPKWLETVGGHLLKKQWLDPHWDARHGDVVAYERATLYGLVVYSGRKVSFAKADPVLARQLFIQQALVEAKWQTDLSFLKTNRRLVQQVMEMEHKSRRQDVLVDDAMVAAFYDQQLPSSVINCLTLEQWYRDEIKKRRSQGDNTDPLVMTQEALMRHEAVGVTAHTFPKLIRLGGVDCSVQYLHEPGDPKDGMTVTVPLFVLNQIQEERLDWLVPGMLKEKILALLKSLPQRPRSRLVPLPEAAERFCTELSELSVFAEGSLIEALLKKIRDETGLILKPEDFKREVLSPHLFMNVKVVDEQGRHLGQGRSLGALKSTWGTKARGAFQALAQWKQTPTSTAPPQNNKDVEEKQALSKPSHPSKTKNVEASPVIEKKIDSSERYTAWTFGDLPSTMAWQKNGQSLVGFPALVDEGDAVSLLILDEPQVAAAKHRQGLRRLVALQIKDALKYWDKNIPDFQKMSAAFMGLGGSDVLKQQLLAVALDRAFLQEPLPHDAASFAKRLSEGRGRLNLIANEVARLASVILSESSNAQRKIKDSKHAAQAATDCQQQWQRLMGPQFLTQTPWSHLSHLPRYLQAIAYRLDKYREDPTRDAQRLAQIKPLEEPFWRLVSERKGVMDANMVSFRWLLEELRVSLFAQTLRTPMPVSVKRLEKAWAQLKA